MCGEWGNVAAGFILIGFWIRADLLCFVSCRSRRVVILHVIDRGGRRNRLVIDIGDAAADLRHLHLVGPGSW